jgi:hypothetical protein
MTAIQWKHIFCKMMGVQQVRINNSKITGELLPGIVKHEHPISVCSTTFQDSSGKFPHTDGKELPCVILY